MEEQRRVDIPFQKVADTAQCSVSCSLLQSEGNFCLEATLCKSFGNEPFDNATGLKNYLFEQKSYSCMKRLKINVLMKWP